MTPDGKAEPGLARPDSQARTGDRGKKMLSPFSYTLTTIPVTAYTHIQHHIQPVRFGE